jgi:hypothetical protein
MKKTFSAIAVIMAVTFISSCEKDAGKLPNIAFKTGANYISSNVTLTKDTTVTIGINASKAEDKDVLKTFDGSKVYDNGASASFYSESLSGSAGNSYSKDLQITTRNQAGTEKYTFTVVNKDGLKNSVTLTVTVN